MYKNNSLFWKICLVTCYSKPEKRELNDYSNNCNSKFLEDFFLGMLVLTESRKLKG